MKAQLIIRSIVFIVAILAPIFIGWIASSLNIQPAGFVLLAIYPQVFLFFPAGYIQSSVVVVILSVSYWVVIFSVSNFLIKKSILIFFATFLVISISSIWGVHIIMYVMGYHLHVDSV
ncbi:hypothetical protein [Halopseudomonas yangmingensis]|uniref:hypothetical protein n=1 Tax=Halopseudomonas yangmingensis TaxID=1720063 RepID=UPI001160B05E|nr:hypothetical protein [Halopseudomonas yangmingensis]